MIKLTCKTCGSNDFKEEKNAYSCKYCNTTLVKPFFYPKKDLKLILSVLILVSIGVFMGYSLLHDVQNDIQQLTQIQIRDKHVSQKPRQQNIDYNEANPFEDIILRVEGKFGNKNTSKGLEKALSYYQEREMNKAFYLALDKKGNYAFGFSHGAKTTKVAAEEALYHCNKGRESGDVNDSCIPYAVNNYISRLIIED